MRTITIRGALIHTLLVSSVLLSLSNPVTAMPPHIGSNAPDWILSTATGESLSFYQDSGHNRAVLLFWATWCKECQALMSRLDSLRQELGDKPLKLYALNMRENGNPLAFMETNSFGFTLLLRAEMVAKRYGIKEAPALFVIGANKKVLYISLQGTSEDELITSVREALAQN